MKTYKEQKELASRMNLLDDPFFHQLPDLYSIFISEIDPFRMKYTTYHIRRSLLETDTTVHNGIHEIYVNTAVVDDSIRSELMQYFKDSNGYNKHFKKISQRVVQLKETNEGVKEMTSVFDEYAQEQLQTAAINLIKNGVSIEMIALSMPSLTLKELQKMKENLELEPAI